MSTKVVYMDNNATTRVAPEVLETMLPYFSDLYGNPSSMHTFGGQVGDALKEAREQIADLVGASADEIIFTPPSRHFRKKDILLRQGLNIPRSKISVRTLINSPDTNIK
jgi:cysteine sulfinate desulfinase/cysteine desulfurase-like protein